MKKWTKPFVHDNRFFEATFHTNPYRDGVEALVSIDGVCVKVEGSGVDDRELIEALKKKIDSYQSSLQPAVAANAG